MAMQIFSWRKTYIHYILSIGQKITIFFYAAWTQAFHVLPCKLVLFGTKLITLDWYSHVNVADNLQAKPILQQNKLH